MHGNCGQQIQCLWGPEQGSHPRASSLSQSYLAYIADPQGLSIIGRCLRRLMRRQLAFGAYRFRLGPLERFGIFFDVFTAHSRFGTSSLYCLHCARDTSPGIVCCFSFYAIRFADVLGTGAYWTLDPFQTSLLKHTMRMDERAIELLVAGYLCSSKYSSLS